MKLLLFALLCVVSCSHVHSWKRGPNGKEYIQLNHGGTTNKTQSRQLCHEVGAILPKPMNSEENDYIRIFYYDFYLGMNASDNANHFVWDDDGTTVTWFEWDDTSSWSGGGGDCVVVWPDAGWLKSPCTFTPHVVLCEKKKPTTPQPTTSPQNTTPFTCPTHGHWADPADPTRYYHCDAWGNWWNMACPTGLHWDQKARTCNWPPQPTPPKPLPPQPFSPQPTTPTANTTLFTCPTHGHWADPVDPTKNYHCDVGGRSWHRTCPENLHWDQSIQSCNRAPHDGK